MTPTHTNAPEDTPEVSVIIPTYNERDNIAVTAMEALRHLHRPAEVIVVDDSSSDGTADIVRELGDPRVRLIVRPKGKGLASAILRGIMASRGAVVCWIDADMAGETRYLPEMVAATTDNDVAIASRLVAGGGDDRHPIRVHASHLVNGFARMVLGYGIKDYDSCVVAVRRDVFDSVLPIAYGFGDFFIEFIYDCCRRGFRVVEVPYRLGVRTDGDSKSCPNLVAFLRLGFRYCTRIIATRFRPY